MDTAFEQSADYLYMIASGRFTVEESGQAFEELLKLCLETGYTEVLVDFSGLTNIDSATLRVMFAVNARALYQRYLDSGGHALRVAFFGDFWTWQPGMDAASENGPGVRTFTDIEEARAWLSNAPDAGSRNSTRGSTRSPD